MADHEAERFADAIRNDPLLRKFFEHRDRLALGEEGDLWLVGLIAGKPSTRTRASNIIDVLALIPIGDGDDTVHVDDIADRLGLVRNTVMNCVRHAVLGCPGLKDSLLSGRFGYFRTAVDARCHDSHVTWARWTMTHIKVLRAKDAPWLEREEDAGRRLLARTVRHKLDDLVRDLELLVTV